MRCFTPSYEVRKASVNMSLLSHYYFLASTVYITTITGLAVRVCPAIRGLALVTLSVQQRLRG